MIIGDKVYEQLLFGIEKNCRKKLFEMKMDMNKDNESAYRAVFTPDGKYIVTYPTYCRTIYEFGD